jgi:quinoprotein glucose dehydrogenase
MAGLDQYNVTDSEAKAKAGETTVIVKTLPGLTILVLSDRFCNFRQRSEPSTTASSTMCRCLALFRNLVRFRTPLAIGWLLVVQAASIFAANVSVTDPGLQGIRVPKGFKVRLVASEPAIVDPAAMAFDDLGNLFVAEWKPAERSIETWETLALPEGGKTRVRQSRKSSTDVVKRLKDIDGDGVYETSEIVLEGCELPTAILPWKNSLYLACVGRLEKWSDEDSDGKFESRTVLIDGFSAVDHRGLSGITLGPDGWLYLTTGDNDNKVVGSDESRVDLLRTGGVVRSTLEGTKLSMFAMGLRNPQSGIAFDGKFHPSLIDGDHEDGSKFQGTRLIQPAEESDYGWRIREGSKDGSADFDRAAAFGEKPGKLGPLARLGRGSPSGMVIYNGVAFPDAFRDLRIEADPTRRVVRGFKIESKNGLDVLQGETTLLASDDDQFRPCQVVVGADGALYVLDRRGRWTESAPSNGEGKAGRLYQITWEGDPSTPAKPLKPNHWKRIFDADTNKLVFQLMASPDFLEADRALREVVERGPANIPYLVGYAGKLDAPLHTRLLGILGARHFWNDAVETAMLGLLNDKEPEIRRLAAQSLGNEPKGSAIRLVSKLTPHLNDPDLRVVREVVLAIGRHGEARAQQNAAVLLRWIYAHPKADPIVKDGFLRAIERLGDSGVEEVALAIRTKNGVDRETAVSLFAGLRSASAAEQLDDLVKIPDLGGSERVALIRQFQEFPAEIPLPTQGLADWVAKHEEIEPAEKIAALDACRLAGNPASVLVLAFLDDEDESVRQAATAIASLSRPPKALDKLEDRLVDKSTSDPERLAIVKALGGFGLKAYPTLEKTYRTGEDVAIRKAALRSMADANRSKALPELEKALISPDPPVKALALQILGESARGAETLARAFLDRTIGRSDLPTVVASLRKHEGAESRKLLASIEEDANRGSTAINPAEIRSKLNQGNPWAGLGVFFRESSRCSSCHKVEGRGTDFGPSLTSGASHFTADTLVEAILNPSKEIANAHETTRVTLKDGRAFIGIVEAKDPKSLTIREPEGRAVKIATELIAETSIEPTSLMPSTVALDLTPDELTDLVAFLQNKSAQYSLKNGPKRLDRVLAIGPFALGADRLRIPLDRVEPARPLPGQDGQTANWITQDATSWGTLNLRSVLGSKPGRAYFAVQIRTENAQAAALRFGVEGATRIYLNGTKVADVSEHDPIQLARVFERPREGELAPLPDLARLSLQAGWNLLIVGVDRTGFGDARAAFEIVGPEPIDLGLPKN